MTSRERKFPMVCSNPECKKTYMAARRAKHPGCSPYCRLKMWFRRKSEAQAELRAQTLATMPAASSSQIFSANERAETAERARRETGVKLERARQLYAERPTPGLANNIFLLSKRLSEISN